jgi:exodeoxyribonuclease V beta subunit
MTTLNLLTSPFDGRSLIEASAGTGKTWTLTALYARLLLEKQLNVGQILVVTYTTAATAELRERIRKRLSELLDVYENGPGADVLLNDLQARFPDPASHRRLLLAVHGFDEAAIFTIHGFCQRALQDSAFDAGGDFDSELTQDDRELVDALLSDLWRQELAHADAAWAAFLVHKRLTPQALRQRLRPHLGKPYLRVEPNMAQTPVLPEVSAAWQRASELWISAGRGWVETLMAHEGLNQNTHKRDKFAGWHADLDAYFADTAGMFGVPPALQKLGALALNKACKKGHEAPVCELASALDTLTDELDAALPVGEQRLIDLHVRLLQALNTELPLRKAAQRLLAFDDLLNQLKGSLEGEGGELLSQALREQYPVALIDEFQDTDPVQYAIFSRIYPREAAPEADLCFVGDPKQAIYAFRGADLNTYLLARDEAARQYTLATNHRSTPELIGALNTLFARPAPFAERGLDYVQVGASQKQRARLVLPDDAAPLSVVWLGDELTGKGEASSRAAVDTGRRIAYLLAAGERGDAYFEGEDGRARLKGGDIAVLVSSHRQAGEIAAELLARGVSSVRRGKESVWHSEEAGDLAAVLAAYAEPGREGLLRYALGSRLLGRNASQLASGEADSRAWDEEREQAERYHQMWQQQGFMRVFRAWLDEQGVAERLLALPDGERRLTNLLHLAELLQAESLKRPGLERLLAWFHAQRMAEVHGEDALLRLESDADRVQIVTIHTSKGLEYPLVFCPYLWDGSLLRQQEDITCHASDGTPLLDLGSDALDTHRQQARQERFAERLRLAYVALTRARDRLWLHWGPIDCAVKKDGSLKEDGLHTSALAWLLHGRANPGVDALIDLAEHMKIQTPSSLLQEIRDLAASSAGGIAIVAAFDEEHRVGGEHRSERPGQLAALPRVLSSAWRIGSFSGLAAGMHMEAPDRDTLFIPDASEPGNGFYAFPRGARAGTCLHAIFEDWAGGKGTIEELVEPALTAHGIDAEQWGEVARVHLQRVLTCDLNGRGLSLAQLDPTQRLPELGFTFPVAQLNMDALRQLLIDPAMGLDPAARIAAERLTFDSLQGFLKGFIDLTFEHDGQWFILDYKSNWLGPDASYYGGERLQQAIAGEHYYLQYLIYLVALRRFLRQRLAGFDDSQLGGAWYLFLRGMPESGVHFARPSDALLDALDGLFEGSRHEH